MSLREDSSVVTLCPLCDCEDAVTVYSVTRAPLQVALPKNAVPVDGDYAPLQIVRCTACGHAYNAAFDATNTGKLYGDTFLTNTPIHVSMTDHLRQIVEWIGHDNYALKSVIEIGAAGGFVSRIVAKMADSVTIFEPCTALKAEMLPEKNIRLFQEMFPASKASEPVDLIICRHVIEHVPNPRTMLEDICRALKPGGLAYLEVPRTEYTYENLTVGDFHQAHVQYFTEDSFQRIARDVGLHPARKQRLKDAHDFGVLFRREATVADFDEGPADSGYDDFPARLSRVLENARDVISSVRGKLALFGLGWQAQGLLAVLPAEPRFSIAFDDNTDFHGAVLHGGGYPIQIAPPNKTFLDEIAAVVIGAPLHDRIIARKVRAMGFSGEIFTPRNQRPSDNEYGLKSLFNGVASSCLEPRLGNG